MLLFEQQPPPTPEEVEVTMGGRRTVIGTRGGAVVAAERNRRVVVEEEERLEIVDLSGISLSSLPNPNLNLATICKLDLSNNNLQVISITKFESFLFLAFFKEKHDNLNMFCFIV